MKAFATWGYHHKIAARILIGVSHIIIFCLACYIGIELKKDNLFIPNTIYWSSASIFLLIIFLFSDSYSLFSFKRRKIIDAFVHLCAFIMIISFANQPSANYFHKFNTIQASFGEKRVKVSEPKAKPSFKELRKEYKELRKLAREERTSAGGIILAIFVGLLLTGLVAGLSCTVACNDQGGLAILVLLAGLTGVFFICKLILKAFKRKKDVPENTTASAFP